MFAACASLQAQRLPQNVVPSHYQLFLDPSISGQRFAGEETINVQVREATREILLNSLGLTIETAEAITGGATQTAEATLDAPNEMVRLTFATPVPAGAASLHLKFSGKLVPGLRGLYLSKSARRQYAVTQFEGTYARMMFPCFDEPGFKAKFDLSVAVDRGDTAISNGRIVTDEPMPGSNRRKLSFSTSPVMSTYLVALAIGDWQCLERVVEGVRIRVCAEPEKKQYGQFALEATAQAIHFYNQWYSIKYPFKKLDLVAIPDYEWGGMENTASIFFRDSSLLLNDASASVFTKRGRAGLVAHEIAHQWFGDLVTPAWWDDIWLNEGFASWMQRKAVKAWHPDWHMDEDQAASAQQVIAEDSLGAARAIHGNPRTSDEIKEMFDDITYAKGAALLSMLESYVGEDVFRKGVNAYLQAHANGNATSADFWQALAKVSGRPVDKIMPDFVTQPGVPLLSLRGSCRNGDTLLQLEQERFYLSSKGDEHKADELWQIPVCTKSAQPGAEQCFLVTGKKQAVTLHSCSWQMANRNAKGYYRVLYPPDALKTIAGAAESSLTAPERVTLVEDAWAMVRAGRASIDVFLEMAQQLRSERSPWIIGLVADHLESIDQALVPDQMQQQFQAFVREQFVPLSKATGWVAAATDSADKKALRASLLGILGSAGDPEAITAARNITQDFMKDPKSAEGTIVGPAIAVAAENGDAALYERFVDGLGKARSSEEFYRYLSGLTSFRQPELAKRTLALVSQGKIRQQDYTLVFASLLARAPAREVAWDYLKAHWDDLAEKVTSFGGRGAVSALGGFCSEPLRGDVKEFFATHHAPGAERALQQSLERMSSCIEFQQAQGPNLENWLRHRTLASIR